MPAGKWRLSELPAFAGRSHPWTGAASLGYGRRRPVLTYQNVRSVPAFAGRSHSSAFAASLGFGRRRPVLEIHHFRRALPEPQQTLVAAERLHRVVERGL